MLVRGCSAALSKYFHVHRVKTEILDACHCDTPLRNEMPRILHVFAQHILTDLSFASPAFCLAGQLADGEEDQGHHEAEDVFRRPRLG